MAKCLFFTGTGTGVGKTHVAALVAGELRQHGQRVGVYKPVASGCRREGARLVSDDAVALWEAAGRARRDPSTCGERSCVSNGLLLLDFKNLDRPTGS